MCAHLHQTQGISEFSEFLSIQHLRENVCYLVGCWDILKLKCPILNLLSNPMVAGLNVSGPCMKNRIFH